LTRWTWRLTDRIFFRVERSCEEYAITPALRSGLASGEMFHGIGYRRIEIQVPQQLNRHEAECVNNE